MLPIVIFFIFNETSSVLHTLIYSTSMLVSIIYNTVQTDEQYSSVWVFVWSWID